MTTANNYVIYKYPVQFEEKFVIKLPVFSQVLSVQVQNGLPQIWVLRPQSDDELIDWSFALIGTGNPIAAEDARELGTFVGTFQNNVFVFHLFVHNRVKSTS
jgi:hypothetical protein